MWRFSCAIISKRVAGRCGGGGGGEAEEEAEGGGGEERGEMEGEEEEGRKKPCLIIAETSPDLRMCSAAEAGAGAMASGERWR